MGHPILLLRIRLGLCVLLSDLAAVPPWLPFSFILYVILGYIVGSFALDKEALENPYALVVPKSLVYGGGIFGAYFAATSIYLLLFA